MKFWARQGSCGILTFILVLGGVSSVSLVVYGQTDTRIVAKRQVAINVKLVFVGIEPSWVLQDYLLWNSPETRYQLIGIPGISTDTIYSVKYDIAFASSS